MVLRILKNPVYTGVLEQGKVTTPSYKVKRLVHKPREDWAVVENCHEAIIDPFDFEIAQRVLALDTRTAQAGQPVELFSGMVYCGECGGAMVRKIVSAGGKRYAYFICAAHKNEKTCYSHSLRTEALENIVLESLQQHIREVIDLSALLELADVAKLQQANMRKLQARLDIKQKELDRCHTLLRSLYESLNDGILEEKEYQDLKSTYLRQRDEAETQIDRLRQEMGREMVLPNHSWMEQFRKHKNISSLERRLVVSLIERVMIYRDRRVELVYRWQDEFQAQSELVNQALPERRAI